MDMVSEMSLGRMVSLISKAEIRYEGTLYVVDKALSAIVLTKVRSFGTEDRPATISVGAGNEIYEYIIFKLTDIKNMVAFDVPSSKEQILNAMYDWSISSASMSSSAANSASALGVSVPFCPANGAMLNNLSSASLGNSGFGGDDWLWSQKTARGVSDNSSGGLTKRSSGSPASAQNESACFPKSAARSFGAADGDSDINSDYDFEKANEEFQKTVNKITDGLKRAKLRDATANSRLKSPVTVSKDDQEAFISDGEDDERKAFYDRRRSFFDKISCESQEHAEKHHYYCSWRKQIETNEKTFGDSAGLYMSIRHARRAAFFGCLHCPSGKKQNNKRHKRGSRGGLRAKDGKSKI